MKTERSTRPARLPGLWPLGRVLVLGLMAVTSGCGSSGPGGGMLSPPETVTLLEVQSQVFSPRCAVSGCHVGIDAPFGLDLSSVGASSANLVGVASAELPQLFRVEPQNATDSYLYMKLVDDPRILGDGMPASGGALNAADLTLIETWINEGAM